MAIRGQMIVYMQVIVTFLLFIERTETMRRRDTLQGISFGISM